MTTLLRDVRHGLRLLGANKTFTAVAVLVLALGMGPNTAMFSVVWGVMLTPLPNPDPDRMVVIWSKVNGERNPLPADDYLEYSRQSRSLRAFAYSAWTERHMTFPGDPDPILGGLATPGFSVFSGIPDIQLGRAFLPDDSRPGNDRVVILNHRLWVERFHSDPNVIGRQVQIDDQPFTIVGVRKADNADKQTTGFVTPLALTPAVHDSHWGNGFARLRPGVTLAQAQAELAAMTRHLAANHPPGWPRNWTVSVEAFRNDWLDPKLQRNLWLLLASVGFVLLIACANVASLLLARGISREKELALRAALGGSSIQLFRQLLSESLVLAGMGGIAGIGLGWALLKLSVALLPANTLPIEADIRLSWPVLLFTVGVSLVAGAVFGCLPALQAARVDLNEALKQGTRTALGGSRLRAQSLLVVAEFSLALTLLAGAGLALHSFWNLTRVNLGFRKDHILKAWLNNPRGPAAGAEQIGETDREILAEVAAVPGVRYGSLSTGVPFGGHNAFPIGVAGQTVRDSDRQSADLEAVTPGFIDVYGLRLIRGRFLDERDRPGTPRVAVVSQSFARRYLAHVDPLSTSLLLPHLKPYVNELAAPHQIVGVVNDVHYGERLTDQEAPSVYVSFWQIPFPWGAVSVRSAVDPSALTGSIRRAVLAAAPTQPLSHFDTMEDIVGRQLVGDRFGAVLYGGFSAVALLLAAVGIYGLMSFAVVQRRHEIGLRMALGARPEQVILLVLSDGMRLALFGIVVGAAGVYAMGRLLRSTLYGMGSIDVASLAAVVAVLFFAALFANYLPARRATHADPLVALRHE